MKYVLAIIPCLFFLCIFYIQTKKVFINKKWKLLLLLIIGGIGSYFCYRLEMHYGSYFKKVKDSNYFEILFYAIFGVAIFEEGYKWLITDVLTLKEKKHMMMYSIITSIGFATFENIVYYAIPYNTITMITRMITAFPSHVINAIWMGYFFQKAKDSTHMKKAFNLVLSIWIPILVHALYNSFLYGGKYQQYFFTYYATLIIITAFLCMHKKKQ